MLSIRAAATAVCCAAMLVACSDPAGPADESSRLETHRRLWARGGVDSYRMVVRLHGAWIGGAATIEVRGGIPVSVTPAGGGPPVLPGAFQHHDTVEELFEVVRFAVEQEAEHLEARYDARFGFPTFVDVDLRAAWADDEHGFAVESFRVLAR